VTPLHADATSLLGSWAAPTPDQERLRREYVEHLAVHADGLDRSCRPDHLTASTLVLTTDGAATLLTLHAKARRWFQLGGHTEPGDTTLAGAAFREATEESGIPGLLLDPVPIHLDAHAVPFCGGPGARHLDVRFLATAPGTLEQVVSGESLDVRWWPVDALPTDEPSLRELVERGLDRLREPSGGADRDRLGDPPAGVGA
jgi:8-oxo-dGTP pyrophosphatase MutT (NUDIX family)